MSDMSAYLGNKNLRWLAGNAFPTAPSSVYMSLYNGDPKSSGTEITTSVRAGGRLAITWSAISAGSDNTNDNSADVDFGASANGSLSVSHVGLHDASTSGNLLWSKAVTGGPYSIDLGTLVKVAAGDLALTCGS